MRLLEPYTYIGPDGTRWLTPRGSMFDGASIPQLAWSVIGGPFAGKYRNAALIHDVACEERTRPWELVHEAFYTAMRTAGVEE